MFFTEGGLIVFVGRAGIAHEGPLDPRGGLLSRVVSQPEFQLPGVNGVIVHGLVVGEHRSELLIHAASEFKYN